MKGFRTKPINFKFLYLNRSPQVVFNQSQVPNCLKANNFSDFDSDEAFDETVASVDLTETECLETIVRKEDSKFCRLAVDWGQSNPSVSLLLSVRDD